MPDAGTDRQSKLGRLFGRWLGIPQSPTPNGKGTKAASGVDFHAWGGWRHVVDLSDRDADAEKLASSTAFAISAYCYVAMWWRASRVAEPPLMVVRETDQGDEWQPSHPLAGLLMDPREDVDMGELLTRTQYYEDLTGAALWLLSRDTLERVALVTPFSASEFRTFAVPPLIYGRYEVKAAGGQWRPVKLEDVIHFREVNPYSWREPAGKVGVALQQLNLGHTVNRIVARYLERAMFPGGIISPDPEWHPSSEEWETWKEAVDDFQAGPAKAGQALYVQGGTTFSRAALGMQDLLPEAVLDRVEATVGAVFGVPPVMLGWLVGLKNSPWSNIEEARKMAYEDTISGLWAAKEKRLTRALLTPDERAGGLLIRFDTSRIIALQQDKEENARVATLAADVATVDERRILMGWEPLPEGDERGQIIVGLQSQAPPELAGLGTGDPADATDPDAGDDDPTIGKSTDTKDLLWLLFAMECKAAEGTWERVIYADLQGLKSRVVALARSAFSGKSAKAAPDDARADFGARLHRLLETARRELTAKAYPLLVSTGGAGVRRVASRLRLSFSVLEPGLLKYAREEAGFLAAVMGKRTGEAVAKAVQQGLEAGETIAALVQRLEQLPDFDRTRAKLTARTETTRAWNGAQRRSLSEFSASSGRKVLKSWLSSRDSRVREEHQQLDGEEVGIDATFSNGLSEPGEPNCRCTLTYTVTEPSGEDDLDVDGGEP